jgi:SAM-dependent methyltransferase
MDLKELLEWLLERCSSSEFLQASFAGRSHGVNPNKFSRVQLRQVTIRESAHVQFSYFDGRKTITKNYPPAGLSTPLAELIALQFSDIHLSLSNEAWDVRVSKQGKVHRSRSSQEQKAQSAQHNRSKNVPLPEGVADPVLEMMGILTASGQVKPTMRSKYVQINEFLKHLTHTLDDAGLKNLSRPIDILDCGCGSAYLTIALHHYLNDVLKLPARVIGVDVNEDIIRKSMTRTSSVGSGTLNFVKGTIRELDTPADVVVALHACNRATDDAIAQAIRSETKLFLGVPCCHQDLNQQLQAVGNAEVLRPLLRHGILKERLAEMLTDTFRALWLRMHGYRTEVVEFTSPEHTARNLMIRAVRTTSAVDPQYAREFADLKAFWDVEIYLEELQNTKKADPQ